MCCPSFWVSAAKSRLHPFLEMLGGNEFRLRRGFACVKTLVRHKSAVGQNHRDMQALEVEPVMWIFFAAGSAFFAGITAILAKCGIRKTDSDVATAIRTIVVLLFSWLMVFLVGSAAQIGGISPYTWTFLILSGLATGASWLCYYKALQDGPASVVVPIDKLSILVTIFFSYAVLHEKLSKKAGVGLLCIVVGTLLML